MAEPKFQPGLSKSKACSVKLTHAVFWLKTVFLNYCLLMKCGVFSKSRKDEIGIIIKSFLIFPGLGLTQSLFKFLNLLSVALRPHPHPCGPCPCRFSLLEHLYRGELSVQSWVLKNRSVREPVGPCSIFLSQTNGRWGSLCFCSYLLLDWGFGCLQ